MIVSQIYVGVDGSRGRWWDLARGRAARLRDPVRRFNNTHLEVIACEDSPVPVVDIQLELLCVVMSCISTLPKCTTHLIGPLALSSQRSEELVISILDIE